MMQGKPTPFTGGRMSHKKHVSYFSGYTQQEDYARSRFPELMRRIETFVREGIPATRLSCPPAASDTRTSRKEYIESRVYDEAGWHGLSSIVLHEVIAAAWSSASKAAKKQGIDSNSDLILDAGYYVLAIVAEDLEARRGAILSKCNNGENRPASQSIVIKLAREAMESHHEIDMKEEQIKAIIAYVLNRHHEGKPKHENNDINNSSTAREEAIAIMADILSICRMKAISQEDINELKSGWEQHGCAAAALSDAFLRKELVAALRG